MKIIRKIIISIPKVAFQINTFFSFFSFFFTRCNNRNIQLSDYRKAFQFFDGFLSGFVSVCNSPRIILYSQFSFSNRINDLADPGKKNFIETTYAILSLSFSLSLIFILPGKSNSDSCSKLVNKFQSYFVNGNEIIPRNCTILFHANVAAINLWFMILRFA